MSISVNVTGALVVKFQSEVWVEEEEEALPQQLQQGKQVNKARDS